MSYKVKKLLVGKGRTTSDEKTGEWIKNYYEIELEIPDEHELSTAKENAEGLLNDWLGITEPFSQPPKTFSWNPDKIEWFLAEGTSGPYERSEDVNNLDFKAMLKDLGEHKGKFQREGYFYWAFQKASIVGRKLIKKKE